jgi:CheY-like chemotaxis protein
MTPVDGVQCLATIRAMPEYASVPAVALTAYARDVEREAFLAAGFQAVVTKPVLDEQGLVAVIDRLLATRDTSPRGTLRRLSAVTPT